MADVITRFKLETTQYDSKLRDAAKGLQEYTKQAELGGKSFTNFSQKSVEAAKALGTVASGANNLKDKVKDLVGAYNDAAKAYNKLSQEQQQSDFGKALAQSINQLSDRIKEAKQELYGLSNAAEQVKSKTGGMFDGKLDGMLQVFGGNMMTKAAGLAVSFASELGDAVSQGIELARAGEGIRIAFERLGRGDILDGLREATHGTVTDLELMKAAVKFNDFKLPVEELGTMLAFAQQKAKDTGQSVDYMVDSIVTGLGRKSLMILDNLGLSAAEIKEKMAETGDMTKAVGEIIREQMQQAGDYVETAADRAAQANVNLQNKMEELGRKFGPLQEASNNLWTSMKIGIMDIVGGPLTNFLNKLTEAGRLANAYGVLGGNGKVGRMTANLSGANEGNRQSIYQQQQQKFWQYINPREQQIKDIRAWQRGERGDALQSRINAITEKYGSLDATKIQAEVDAAKKMLSDYQQAAKTILHPVKADIDTSGAENNVDSLKKKLKELEEQRKKAIKAGDTELAKNLTKQINQTKTNIRGLDPKALSTSTGNKTTPQEKALDIVTNAERTYAETLQKAAIRMEVGLDSTLEGKKKELAAQERLFDAYNDAYATYKDQKYKDAANEAADKIKSLAGEVKGMEDAAKQLKVKWEQGASGFNTQTMNAWMQGRQSDLSKAEYGSVDYSKIMTNIADMNAIKTVLEQSMRAGIDAAQFDLEPLWEKVFDGDNIPDNVWQGMVDKINEKLKEIGIEPIKIDFKTGSIAKEGEKTEKSWQAAAQAVQSVGGAMQSIEDPAAKVAGTIAQAIASIALGYAQATTQAATLGPWAWVAFAATGMAQMISMISAIHSSTGYAEGGIIKGNSYSGDNLMAQGPNGQLIGLNAGEVVLNRAQQGVIAGALQGGGQTVRVVGKLSGESIFICAENWAKRAGKGEFVTWRQ